MLAALPHYWSKREDTRFEIAKFKRKTQTGGGNPDQEWSSQGCHSFWKFIQ
jgi:hypothetical protein